jgi:hypothetical protein
MLMADSLAAIFYYADGCSRWVPDCVPDPPPNGIDLRAEEDSPGRHHPFRLQAVHKDIGEAWYTEVARASIWRKAS